jgi:hypothetical protein
MTTLRWISCVALVLLAVGYVAVFILASNFRRSFGASATGPLLLVVPLLVIAGLVWWIAPKPGSKAPYVQPAALAYPVLLVDEDKISEVCFDADELTLRPENTDHIIEQRFHVVASDGRRYGIANFRQGENRPPLLKRVATATVNVSQRFRVTFDLRPERVLGREEVLAQLRDRPWTMPGTTATTPLAELFTAYRADRWREFGNSRDRMPDERTGPQTPNPARP